MKTRLLIRGTVDRAGEVVFEPGSEPCAPHLITNQVRGTLYLERGRLNMMRHPEGTTFTPLTFGVACVTIEV
jgi:hypothetical protein